MLSGWGVGAEGMEVNLATDWHPGTNTKPSWIAFVVTSIVLILESLGTQLLGRHVHSLIESPGTLDSSRQWSHQGKSPWSSTG